MTFIANIELSSCDVIIASVCLQALLSESSQHLTEVAQLKAKEQELSEECAAFDRQTSSTGLDETLFTVPAEQNSIEQLQNDWSQLYKMAEKTSSELSADVSHWSTYEALGNKILLWLQKTEQYVDGKDALGKSSSLDEAKQQLNQHDVILNDLVSHEALLKEFSKEAEYVGDKDGVEENVKEMHARWTGVVGKLGEKTSALQHAVETWTKYVDHVELVRRQMSTITSRKLSLGEPVAQSTNVDALQDQLKAFKVG